MHLLENLLAVEHFNILDKAIWNLVSIFINSLCECILDVSPDSLAEHSEPLIICLVFVYVKHWDCILDQKLVVHTTLANVFCWQVFHYFKQQDALHLFELVREATDCGDNLLGGLRVSANDFKLEAEAGSV